MAKRGNPGDEKIKLSVKTSLEKIYRYCAWQERSHQEVRDKLFSYGLTPAEVDELLSKLIVEGFLNEERFAKAFAGGKFRMQKWGRNKITWLLESKGLTANCIQSGLKEIEEPEYSRTLKEVILRRKRTDKEENIFIQRDKIARYAISRGYEPDLVWSLVREIITG